MLTRHWFAPMHRRSVWHLPSGRVTAAALRDPPPGCAMASPGSIAMARWLRRCRTAGCEARATAAISRFTRSMPIRNRATWCSRMSPEGRMTGQRQRSCLIAGGAGGMGIATAKRLAARGHPHVIADLPGPRLHAAASALAQMGADHLIAPLDIRDVVACREAVAAAAKWGDGLDILVNAAGLWLEGPSSAVQEEEWD